MAEVQLAETVGYNLLPDWDDRIVNFPRSAKPEIRTLFDSLSRVKSLEVLPHFISGGVRATTSVEASAPIVFSDPDGDGFNELGTVTVPAGSLTDVSEIRAFFSGHSAEPAWEIRPIKVSLSGGNFIIQIQSWLLGDPDLAEVWAVSVIDGDDPASFVSTVDIYRVYNDPSIQAQLLWGPESGECSDPPCEGTYQDGCLHTRDARLGLVSFSPGTWDAESETFSRVSLLNSVPPDRVRCRYYSGYELPGSPLSKITMDPYWETTIVALSCTLLDRPVCSCSNVESYIDRWVEDLSRVQDDHSYVVNPSDLACPFGTYRGSIYAWRRCFQEGRRISR
ncbi:MAG: hypothetical protein QUS07_07345 [Methanothrix sp.]|nr:hypothetical protein [Methanothrix sp.]